MKKILSILTIFATAAIAIAPVSSINSVNSATANSQAQIANSQSQAALIPQDANLTISATEPTHKEFVKEIANKTIQEQFKSFLDGEMDSIIIQTKASIRTDSPLAIDIYNNANANKQSLAKRIRTEIARKQRSLK